MTVQVWLWRAVASPDDPYLSTRPGDSGQRVTTGPLDMSAVSGSGRFNQSGIVEIEVPLGE